MPEPQVPHFAKPVSRVGLLMMRGGAFFGLRAARLVWTRSKSASSISGGTGTAIQSAASLRRPVFDERRLKWCRPV